MRIAALSDIHGNLWALEAVLADVARRGADVVVNLGDILSGPLLPGETADRLLALGWPTIAGNHERQVLTQAPERMGASDAYVHQRLTQKQREWLGGLSASLRLQDDVLMVHGTPGSDLIYWLETVTEAGSIRAATQDEVLARAAGAPVAPGMLVLCGHSHVPRAVQLDDGRLIVNPGSVGLQAYDDDMPYRHVVANGTPHARYALVEKGAHGWCVEHVAVPYEWGEAAALAGRNGFEAWEVALRTGRMG